MTDSNDDFDLDDSTTDDSESAGMRQLRQAAKDGKRAKADAEAAKADADAARRELAFVRAGIDPDSQTAKRIAKVHDGDFTVDAIKATAVEYGWAEPETPKIDPQELAQHDQFSAASSFSQPNPTAESELIQQMQDAKANWFRPDSAGAEGVFAALEKAGVPVDRRSEWKFDPNGARGLDGLGTKYAH